MMVRAVLAVEPAHELEDLDLMLEIEKGIVQQENFRFLGQGAGDDHSLLPYAFLLRKYLKKSGWEHKSKPMSSCLATAHRQSEIQVSNEKNGLVVS